MKSKPPLLADRFLKWFCFDELLEEVQGDLHEAFHHRVTNYGLIKAWLWYWVDVVRFFKPYSFEKFSRSKQFIPMFNNYFKIAFRNILKRKGFSLINITGLVSGISAVLIIYLYVFHEMSYDSAIPEANNTYRLINHYREQTYTPMSFHEYNSSTAETQLRTINYLNGKEEVLNACQFMPTESPVGGRDKYYFQYENQKLTVENLLYTNTGKAFQEMFPQVFIQGNPETAFDRFGTIVLTSKIAATVFGSDWKDDQVTGKQVTINNVSYKIGGVIDDVKGNAHFDFDILVYLDKIPSWAAYTYFTLRPEKEVKDFLATVNKEIDLVFPGYWEDELSKGLDYMAIKDIHVSEAGMLYEIKPVINVTFLYTFSLIGFIIILIIWTNYSNLSVARYAGRQREIGVRKVMGAGKKDIVFQILTEAILLTLMAIPFILILVYWALPAFNQLMEVEIPVSAIFSVGTLILFFVIMLLTGIISGLYPAVIFSRKALLKLMDGKLGNSGQNRLWNLRNGLLSVQFFMLIGLLSLSFFINQQMNHVLSKELGYEKDGIVYFRVDGKKKYDRMEEKLVKIPGIEKVGTGFLPGNELFNQLTYKLRGTDPVFSDGTFLQTGYDALQVIGLPCEPCSILKAGQDSVFVINETAARKLAKMKGLDQVSELIGEVIITEPEYENERFGLGIPYTIAGIIPDFDYFSLRNESQPLLMRIDREPQWAYIASVKANTDNWFETISKIEEAYLEVEEQAPFDFLFLDEHLNQLYKREQNAGVLIAILTGIAVVLAVLGLIGVVGFITLNRRKEISIRKVFGASFNDILYILNKEFILLMGIATILVLPVSIYMANKWLDSFAYRIEPSFWMVGLAGLITLLTVVLIVLLQSYSTLRLNPSNSLRNE